jgi:ABC-2 type transport system ATP-binding protein
MIAASEDLFRSHNSQQPGVVVARLSAVGKRYGDISALRAVTLDVRAGELLALLGPNGAGKTTTVKLLLGLASPDAGSVSVFGGDPRHPENRIRTGAMLQVGRVPETVRVREHIDLFSSYYAAPLPLAETVRVAGLQGLEKRPFGELSGGQKQRLLFALAICGNPDLLVLDEPTVGLDVEARRFLWDEIRRVVARGKTVLLTTHYLQEADALADRIVVMNRGGITAEGTPAEIKACASGRQIRCVTQLPIAEVCAIPSVIEVQSDRGSLMIRAADADSVLRELLSRDPQLYDLHVTSAGLEDAFLALTRNSENHAGKEMQ